VLEIKPMLSQMMRQLRSLKSMTNAHPDDSLEIHAKVERSCMRLWEFLEDLNQFQGDEIAENAFPDMFLDKSSSSPGDEVVSGMPKNDQGLAGRNRSVQPKRDVVADEQPVRPKARPQPRGFFRHK